MVYDGVLSRLLGIDLDEMKQALQRQLGKKPKALAMNQAALEAGFAFADANLEKRDPFRVERMDATAGKILIEGNAAAALGCLMAGVTVVGWYPITPSSSLCETLIDYLRKYRMDPETGKATFAVVQAEDEISALGMVHRRRLGRRARDDLDLGARHLADGRVRRPRLLRRGAGRDLRRAARGPVDRPADAHDAGRHRLDRVAVARRHQARAAAAALGGGVLLDGHRTPSISPSACRRPCSC